MNDFYKIGQVIEVRGQKLRIRVFENKNSNILVYQGHVIILKMCLSVVL